MSYEEVYKNAYSHGLENIYALEIVDINSVRPLPKNQKLTLVQLNEEKSKLSDATVTQLQFDFGHPHRDWMESFILGEPIHVLGLSGQAEKGLQRHDKFILKDLIEADFQDFIFLKGLGQGHLDEIQKKLQAHLETREIYQSKTIDFSAWLRSLCASLDKKKACATAEAHNIEELFPLTPAEVVEVRNLVAETRQKWIQETLNELKSEKRRETCRYTMQQVVEAYIAPWMRRRGGVASYDEILDHLLILSDTPDSTESVLTFFAELYFDGNFPPSQFLYSIDNGIFAVDEETAISYQNIVEKALTYYYREDLSYSLNSLTCWIERELTHNWQNFNEGFVEKALGLASCFLVRKDESGKLSVRLA